MAATLSGLRERVAVTLADSDHRVWGEAALDEALRQALGEYRLASGGEVVVEGLDGALATTLPAAHESLIVSGAAGYAGAMRAIDRVEGFDSEHEAPALVDWAGQRLLEFRQMLAVLFPGYGVGTSGGHNAGAAERQRLAALHASTNPAWGRWLDEGEAEE